MQCRNIGQLPGANKLKMQTHLEFTPRLGQADEIIDKPKTTKVKPNTETILKVYCRLKPSSRNSNSSQDVNQQSKNCGKKVIEFISYTTNKKNSSSFRVYSTRTQLKVMYSKE